MPIRTALLLLCLGTIPACAQGIPSVCDLSDENLIKAFTSGDSDISIAEGPAPGSHALGLLFKPVNDWPSARYQLPVTQDWSRADVLSVTLRNDGPTSATLEVGVVDARGRAYKPARRVPPGKWTEIRIPVSGMSAGADESAWCGEAIDTSRVVRFWFLAYSPDQPLPCRFASIRLLALPRLPAPQVRVAGAADGVSLTWAAIPGAGAYDIYRRAPGGREARLARFSGPRFVDVSAQPGTRYSYRVAAVDELRRAGRRSPIVTAALNPSAPPGLPPLSRYGGRTDMRLDATGFFRAQRRDGRWALVDPEGHPMLSVGICVIGLGDSYTRVSKREGLFKDALAEKSDPRFKAAWDPPYGYTAYGLEAGTGLVFSPYVRGLIGKHGADWEKRWQEETVKRLDDWHVNATAAFSGGNFKRAYVSFTAGWGDAPLIPTATGHVGVPDVFDPAFERNVNSSAEAARSSRDDPWLIGWFTANEMGWYGDWEQGMNLVNLIHVAPASLAAKNAWVGFLKTRYPDIAALNAAWDTQFGSLGALADNHVKMPNKPAARRDSSAFLAMFADRYFRLTAEAIRRNDPRHLILGARHSQGAPAEVIRAESCYNDVVSATIYGFRPRRSVLNGSCDTDKPWLAGEFHFQARDAGLPFRQVDGIYPTQAARGDAYQDYLADGFALPEFIGAHWFEYIDEPVTGRFDGGKDGGECYNIGWVNVADEPYREFVARARLANANLPLLLK